jgi:phage-related protein
MAINIAMALNPLGLIVIGVVALVAGLALAYTRFEAVRNIVNAVFNAMKVGVDFTVEAVKGLIAVFRTVFNTIGTLWNNSFGRISFTIPDIIGVPGRGTSFSIPKIPALAAGGIVTGPTLALIGEAGPEAVIPLDRAGGMGGINITVNAGLVSSPDQVGQQIIEAIQKAQRRSGPVFAPA